MNARYVLNEAPSELGAHFGIDIVDNFPARYNIAPSQPVPVIRTNLKGGREYTLLRWGFVPGWDTAGTFFKKAIVNIRSESAPEKASFRGAWKRRHCLFPMNGLYEWQNIDGQKQPFFICRGDPAPVFCLAGLWEHWIGADGSEMETAAFLTREAEGDFRQMHHRMPIVVRPEDYDLWLTAPETVGDDKDAQRIISDEPPSFQWWPVHPAVNSWKPEGAQLIERYTIPTQGSLL